ncbi:hypothetical protein RI054_16g76880 [Pseudoscourfieldia marina]
MSSLPSQQTVVPALKDNDFECWACATTTTGRPPRLVDGGWFLPLQKKAPNSSIRPSRTLQLSGHKEAAVATVRPQDGPTSEQEWMIALFAKADAIHTIVQARAAANAHKKPLPSLPPPPRTNLDQTPRRYSLPEYRRDTAFYWRYVYNGTDHPTQEVPCSKRPGQKYWAVTFADGAVRNRIARLHTRPSCLLHGIDEFRIFGPSDLDPEYKRRNQRILEQKRGVGLWIWKHYVQYRTLFEMNDADVLLYIDSDFRCDPSILQYMCLAQTNDIVGFHHSNADYTLSKLAIRDSMILMGLDTSAVATSVQSSGGNVIFRKTPTTIAFMREMAAWSQQEAVVGNWGVPSFAFYLQLLTTAIAVAHTWCEVNP